MSVALTAVAALFGATAAGEDGTRDRVAWSTSRIAGTPEPSPPYAVERLYPALKLDRPLLATAMPGSDRLVVGEQGGKVVTFRAGDSDAVGTDLAIDLAPSRPGFAALYGLAFHPRFVENRYVYLCYAIGDGVADGSKVSRFAVAVGDPPRIDPASEEVVLTFRSGGHNGGCLAFGPEGYLYLSTGDAAGPSPPDPLRTGQDAGDLLSSIVRIDVDRRDPGKPYAVPCDNPWVGQPGTRPELWAIGLRNPWRMGFDRETGELWVGDVGWELWELIYRVERGGNYGWSLAEGRQPILPELPKGPGTLRGPIVDHPHTEAASITGGYVYRGRRLADLVGTYVYGDYQSGKVWGLRMEGDRVAWRGELADSGLRLVSFGEDADGELILIDHERSNGLYRLVPNPSAGASAEFPRILSATGLFADAAGHKPAAGVEPYAINAEAWDDGATAVRLLAVPGQGRIAFDDRGRWRLPDGSALAKTVAIELVAGDPSSRRRLETQVLHREGGSWRPYTYAWRDDQTDADLVAAGGASRSFRVVDRAAPGGERTYEHRFASRAECGLCHNPWAGEGAMSFGRQSASPLALTTGQVDRDGQVERLARLGFFETEPPAASERRPVADPYGESATVEARARAYLAVNCAHCHQFNAGGAATIELAADLPIDKMRLVGERPTQGTFGIDGALLVAPGEPERSVLFYRLAKTGAGRMPRVGTRQVDERGARLIGDWIAGLEGAPAGGARDELSRLIAAAREGHAGAIERLAGTPRGALALARGVLRGEVAGPALEEVAERAGAGTGRAEVRDLFERLLPESRRVARLGEGFDPAIVLGRAGDADRGRSAFFSESATACASCHKVGGRGGEVGPALDAIGSKYDRTTLLRHVVEPAREVDPKFATVVVATVDGRVIEGLLVEEAGGSLSLRDAKGQLVRIEVDRVEERATRPGSLMPEGLLRDLSAQQAADLLEFLVGLRGP